MWSSLFVALTRAMERKQKKNDFRQKRKDHEEEALASGPSWRHRRRLIHIAFVMGVAMILFGAATVLMESTIGVEMIIGGVALISIIITAYTTSATYEDVRLWNDTPRVRFGEGKPAEGASPESVHNYETDNPDGT